MRKLDPKSAGVRMAPLCFLKICEHSLSLPLAQLFLYSTLIPFYLQVGCSLTLHLFLRMAIQRVSQIISSDNILTSTTCKLTTDILCSYLFAAGRKTKHQHVFITKHSTTTNLL